MHGESRVPLQPALHLGGLARRVAVEDRVDRDAVFGGNRGTDGVEGLHELPLPGPAVAPADDPRPAATFKAADSEVTPWRS